MSIPTDDKARKSLPVFTGNLMYFPLVALAVAEVSRTGNEQHNPGEPLHWAREKSTDQMNTALRHMMDHGMGTHRDTDKTWHLAKAIWRLSAELQLTIEAAVARGEEPFCAEIPLKSKSVYVDGVKKESREEMLRRISGREFTMDELSREQTLKLNPGEF